MPPVSPERAPALSIELVTSNKTDDLLHREADIAARMFRPVQEALVVKRVGGIDNEDGFIRRL